MCFVFPSDYRSIRYLDNNREDDEYEKYQDFTVDEIDKFETAGRSHLAKIIGAIGHEHVSIFYCSKRRNLFVVVSPDLGLLRRKAERDNFELLLDKSTLIKQAISGFPEKNIGKIELGTDEPNHLEPFQFLYAPYRMDLNIQHLYAKAPGYSHPFSITIQVKLVIALLEGKEHLGGAGLSFKDMIFKRELLAYFPLHEEDELNELIDDWYGKSLLQMFRPWDVPFNKIRAYFGEKIALYHKFYSHYTTWLVCIFLQFWVFWMNNFSSPFTIIFGTKSFFPSHSESRLIPLSLVGIFLQFWVFWRNNFSSPFTIIFGTKSSFPSHSEYSPSASSLTTECMLGGGAIIWATLMLGYWRRIEALTALEWGMQNTAIGYMT